MTHLQVTDLPECRELDTEAYAEICGGMNFGFLSNLQAFLPGGLARPSNSFFYVDNSVTQNIFQQNPVNITVGAGDNSVIAIDSISPTTVSAGSPMTFVQGALPGSG